MNKFSLLFITFVFLGGIVASGVNVQTTVDPHVKVIPAHAELVPAKVEVTPGHVDVVPTQVDVTPAHVELVPAQVIVASTEVKETVPAVVSVKGEVNTSTVGPKVSCLNTNNVVPAPAPVVSMTDKVKVFLGGFLVKAEEVGSVAKYYLLGDVLTDWLSKKGFIVTPDAGLINAYVNGVTPRRLVNSAAAVILISAAYYGYKYLSKDQDEDDFFLDEEDENIY